MVVLRSVPLKVRVIELMTYSYHEKLELLRKEYPRITRGQIELRIVHEERIRDWRYDYQ